MFQHIVSDTATRSGQTIHYEHGHPIEIVGTLFEMTKNPTQSAQKFPLIALIQDFPEDHGKESGVFSVKFNLIIACLTDPLYKAKQRYDINFIPVLFPIYESFMEAVSKSGYFMETNSGRIEHIKTDCMGWGKDGLYGGSGNQFNDYIDVIEIKDLSLKIKIKNC